MVQLDRVLINLDWSQKFLGTECKARTMSTSDHTPLLIEAKRDNNRPSIFRYENHWCLNPELIQITKDRLQRGTRPMVIATRLNHRLRMVRAATRDWAKRQSSRQNILANNEHVVSYFDAVEEWRKLTNGEFHLRGMCQQKISSLATQHVQYWRRRAKIKWCNLGDENTRFFHTMATYRHRSNKIKCLQHEGVEIFEDVQKIHFATAHFKSFFMEQRSWASNLALPTLYDSQHLELDCLQRPFTWEEIILAIRRAPPNKSPGPDGFTNEFYKKNCGRS